SSHLQRGEDDRGLVQVPEQAGHGCGSRGAPALAPPAAAGCRETPSACAALPRRARRAALPGGSAMSKKNMAASVHARLTDIARRTDRPFQELLQYYAMERFLYRLSKSPHAARFVLKGALMLRVWDAPMARPTKDIDLLGRLENSLENLSTVVPTSVPSKSSRMACSSDRRR